MPPRYTSSLLLLHLFLGISHWGFRSSSVFEICCTHAGTPRFWRYRKTDLLLFHSYQPPLLVAQPLLLQLCYLLGRPRTTVSPILQVNCPLPWCHNEFCHCLAQLRRIDTSLRGNILSHHWDVDCPRGAPAYTAKSPDAFKPASPFRRLVEPLLIGLHVGARVELYEVCLHVF